MPEKKKSSVIKSAEKRTADPEPSGAVRPAEPVRAASLHPANGGHQQRSAFDAAIKLFHARNMKQARELFEQASAGPERDVAQRARLHMAMCDRRLEQEGVICDRPKSITLTALR